MSGEIEDLPFGADMEAAPVQQAAVVAPVAPSVAAPKASTQRTTAKQAAVTKSALNALFQPAKSGKTKQFANILIYGDPGTGKTTMCGRVSLVPGEVVYILTEPHHEATIRREAPDCMLCVARSWSEVLQALSAVEQAIAEGTPIKYVVLDSLDDAQDGIVADHYRRNPKMDMRRVGGERNQGTMQILQRLRNLECHTIVVCKAELKTIQLADGRSYETRYPRIAGKQMDTVALGVMHAVGYTETPNVKGQLRFVVRFRTADDFAWTKATGRLKPAYLQENFAAAIADACDVGGESLTQRTVEVEASE